MADNTLAHRAQNATTTETMHLPPTAAPTNHGKTLAAWVTTYSVVIAFTIAGLGVLFAMVWLFWVGIGAASSPAWSPARRCRRRATVRAATRRGPGRRAPAGTDRTTARTATRTG